ncbi:MAG: D-tyrosyl-tRNA(Tyr) deacylase [Clostridia bacterium]|nr:D-tyrosyl-tRNA(Tyr) deacylase [Clostridia bacterium]
MKIVIQRVTRAKVTVDNVVTGSIGRGFTVLLGIRQGEGKAEAELLVKKLCALRICDDENGVMNLSLPDYCERNGGEAPSMLVVSQFTLYADVRRGNRPSYIDAAPPEQARPVYEYFVDLLRKSGIRVETGIFQADMQVELVNDGPVTIIIDTDELKKPRNS